MFLTKLRLKIRNFIKQYRLIIIIILVVWAIIFIINLFLKNRSMPKVEISTYEPHQVLLTSNYSVPDKLNNPIEDLIDDYINKCNSGDYSGAYELLADDCKKYAFDDSYSNFEKYIKELFPSEKRYTIQNYSNKKNFYIYNLKLIDNIIETGLTGQEYAFYEEKIVFVNNNNKLQLYVNDYMGYSELKRNGEDDNVKIRIESKEQFYNREIYTIRVTNKSDKNIIIYDGVLGNEIQLVSEDDYRNPMIVNAIVSLIPDETRTFKVVFNKYYDESVQANSIIFNSIRIMKDDQIIEDSEGQLENAEKIYSMEIGIK